MISDSNLTDVLCSVVKFFLFSFIYGSYDGLSRLALSFQGTMNISCRSVCSGVRRISFWGI